MFSKTSKAWLESVVLTNFTLLRAFKPFSRIKRELRFRGHFLQADPLPVSLPEFPAHPRTAIPMTMPGNYFPNKTHQFGIGCIAPPGLSIPFPLVIGAAAYPQKPGHLLNGISLPVGLNESVCHYWGSPCAKMTAAFFRISADFSPMHPAVPCSLSLSGQVPRPLAFRGLGTANLRFDASRLPPSAGKPASTDAAYSR
jgi:hypothetical protein